MLGKLMWFWIILWNSVSYCCFSARHTSKTLSNACKLFVFEFSKYFQNHCCRQRRFGAPERHNQPPSLILLVCSRYRQHIS